MIWWRKDWDMIVTIWHFRNGCDRKASTSRVWNFWLRSPNEVKPSRNWSEYAGKGSFWRNVEETTVILQFLMKKMMDYHDGSDHEGATGQWRELLTPWTKLDETTAVLLRTRRRLFPSKNCGKRRCGFAGIVDQMRRFFNEPVAEKMQMQESWSNDRNFSQKSRIVMLWYHERLWEWKIYRRLREYENLCRENWERIEFEREWKNVLKRELWKIVYKNCEIQKTYILSY